MDIEPEVVAAIGKIFEALVNGLFASGLILAVYNARRLRKAKKAGISEVEHVAAAQTAPQAIIDPLTAHLRGELRKAYAKHQRDAARIDRLEAQIWKGGLGPPVD
jgi:hypothetical protein